MYSNLICQLLLHLVIKAWLKYTKLLPLLLAQLQLKAKLIAAYNKNQHKLQNNINFHNKTSRTVECLNITTTTN